MKNATIRLDQLKTVHGLRYTTDLDTLGWTGRKPRVVHVQGVRLANRTFFYDVDGELEFIRYHNDDYTVELHVWT
jgi:hypothetical protein